MNVDTTLSSSTRIPQNAAIRRCYLAEKRSRRESRLQGLDIVETEINADEAYRKAMPELIGHENIRDFIACVAHGMVTCNVTAFQASKLLYAAQVALSAFARQPRPGKSQAPDPSPLPALKGK
ncbi:MAG TPA: hypothetical protein VFD98_10420 [Terracidiphilus sp.]|jgi:hypothetical protein|nr:hypothetical protein [Terracidiphilus sp.]